MKRIFWLMLVIVVVATGTLLVLRQYLYVEPVTDIIVTTSEDEIVLTAETYIANNGTRTILENDVQNGLVFLTYDEYNRVELSPATPGSGAKYEDLENGLEVWEKAGNIFIYKGDTKLFESVITLTDMVENDSRTYLVDNSPWKWIETVGRDGQVVTPIKAEAFTLTFMSDGEVHGTTDCNNFSGTYSVNKGELLMGPFMSTLKGCEQTQETEFTSALGQVVDVAITKEGNLYLELAGDSGWMVLARPSR